MHSPNGNALSMSDQCTLLTNGEGEMSKKVDMGNLLFSL